MAYQATIEDDLLLEPGFARFVEALTARHALTEEQSHLIVTVSSVTVSS